MFHCKCKLPRWKQWERDFLFPECSTICQIEFLDLTNFFYTTCFFQFSFNDWSSSCKSPLTFYDLEEKQNRKKHKKIITDVIYVDKDLLVRYTEIRTIFLRKRLQNNSLGNKEVISVLILVSNYCTTTQALQLPYFTLTNCNNDLQSKYTLAWGPFVTFKYPFGASLSNSRPGQLSLDFPLLSPFSALLKSPFQPGSPHTWNQGPGFS